MFDEVTMITGLLNQGRNQGNDYVTSYKLEYTEDGVNWQTLNNDIGVEQVRSTSVLQNHMPTSNILIELL